MTNPGRIAVAALMATTAVVAAPIAVSNYRAAALAASPQTGEQALPPSFAAIVDRAKPAVVTVTVKVDDPSNSDIAQLPFREFGPGGTPFDDFFKKFFQDPSGNPREQMPGGSRPHELMHGLGSGFIVDPSGLIVTNNHVVENASDIRVTLDDGTDLPATLVGRDEKTDLAVIKVKAERSLPTVDWGDSDHTVLGDWVVAIGNPFGLGGTVTAGIVSARGRDLHAGPYDDFLQIDAAINRGNSGGPLFDTEGKVIGVTSAIYSPNGGNVGVGFAIPSNLARDIISKLETDGHIERGYLGVSIQPLTPDIADALGLKPNGGALVAEVTADSPAARSGIEAGDVITGFAGQPITSPHDLSRSVADVSSGTSETVEVFRNGETKHLSAVIARMPNEEQVSVDQPSADEEHGSARLGLSLTDLTPELRSELNLSESDQGAVVSKVTPGEAAAEAGIEAGDLIVAVGPRHVADAGDAITALRQAESGGNDKILVLVEHQGHRLYVTLDSQLG